MHAATLQVGRLPIAVAFVLSLLRVSSAYADQITLMWDPNSDQVTGYAVYVGSSPRIDVGNTTSYTLSNAVAGQQYCFAVAAYNATGEGPKSGQLCGYSNRFPTLTNPGNRTATAGQATSLQLSGSDPDGQPITYAATGMPPGLFIGSATGFISGTPTTAGTYTVTASVFDGVLTSPSQNFTWTVTAAADTTLPVVSISGPTTTSSTPLSISGTASDNIGVTQVTWVNDRGGSGTASGTTSWSASGIALQSGANTITVTAYDAAGNKGTAKLTITYNAPDTTLPVVSISGPTTSSSTPLSISGTASDNIGVTQVTWANDRGGSGNATGTASWSASGIALQSGANNITVTAYDAAGNKGTATLTVNYTAPDISAPTITILGPTTASSYTSARSVETLGGTSSDNLGVTAVTWAVTWPDNSTTSGFSSGTTNWSVPSVSLEVGSNVITMTAQDAAGNKGTAVLTINRLPPPQCTYNGGSYATGATLSITMKNGVVDTWLAARVAEGWVLVSRTKARSQTTVTVRCG